MTSLSSTHLEFFYKICFSKNDSQMINNICEAMTVSGVIIAFWNVFIGPLPYGKHLLISKLSLTENSRKINWISFPLINARLAWQMCLSPTIGIPVSIFIFTKCEKLENPYNLLAFILFVAHYVNRVVIYTFRISKDATPVSWCTLIMLSASSINSLLQSHHLANVHFIEVGPTSYLGFLIFLIGMAINTYHDILLTNLRKNNKSAKDETVYKIPQGGLFKYISCPNYLGEIVEWYGFAMFTNGYPQLVLAMVSTVMIGLRAYHHHKFYKTLFSNSYPTNRKALIPFVF